MNYKLSVTSHFGKNLGYILAPPFNKGDWGGKNCGDKQVSLPKRDGRKLSTAILSIFSACVTFVNASVSYAVPYPDRIGICYFFKEDDPEVTQTCVISTGYGAGAQYVILHGVDGSTTKIFNNTLPTDHSITVDDMPATYYQRDAAWYRIVENPQPGDELMSCYQIVKTNNSVCYRFAELE